MSIFYKIISPQGTINYLFGTIHSNKTEYVVLPFEVKKALDESTRCIFEANDEEIFPPISKKLAKQRKDLADVSKRDLPIAEIWLENSITATPQSVAYTLMGKAEAVNPLEYLNVLDSQLKNYAKVKNKNIAFLASMESMADSLFGFDLSLLEKIQFYHFMRSALARCGKFLSNSDCHNAYRQQNIDILRDTLNPFASTDDIPEPVRRYFDGLGTGMDLKMVEAMKTYLNQGNAFIAVGAGHLKGILTKLQTENYTIEAIPLGTRTYPIDGSLEDGEKVAAFRKIYTALYTAQTSLFKIRNFFPSDKMTISLEQILQYTAKNPNTRSAKAWELAQLHYKDLSSSNTKLLKAICHEGYAKSSILGFFKRTRTNLDDPKSVAQASSDTRGGAVRDILNNISL